MSLTKMDLTESRSKNLEGIGMGGVDASDGVMWVNPLDGQPLSGHSSMSHSTMHLS